MKNGVTIKVTADNTQEVLRELEKKVGLALEGIGGEAEKYAKEGCPVDTGRLRNSITFVTETAQGTPNTYGGASAEPGDFMKHGTPEKNTVYVGTNVEYAPEQEYYGRRKHFLKNALTMHSDRYKKITEAALKA
jgi:hypothetical protein